MAQPPKKKVNIVKPHIIIQDAPETVPIEYDGPPETYMDDEPEDLAAMPEMGSCDGDGCIVMYELGNNLDHCAEEGTCWLHCSDVDAHGAAQNVPDGSVILPSGEVALAFEPPKVLKWGKPKPVFNQELIDDLVKKANAQAIKKAMLEEPPVPAKFDLDQTLAYVSEAIAMGPQEVFEAAKGILEQVSADGYVPTNAERVALFVAGLEAIAYAEHGQVVAITEGRTLAKHRADFAEHECGVCENLDAYTTKALDLLKPIAAEQVTQAQEQAIEAQRIVAGLCVDCGQPAEDGRTYSLEEGKGFMCSKCAGPFLLMDDGKPGLAWEEAQA